MLTEMTFGVLDVLVLLRLAVVGRSYRWRGRPGASAWAPLGVCQAGGGLCLERWLVGGGQAQHGAGHCGRCTELRLQRPKPDRHMGFGVITGEVDVAGDEDRPRPDDLQ